MTKVTIFLEGNHVRGFKVKGHSGFAQSGEDIVCAGISALTQGAVRGLQGYLKLNPLVEVDKGLLSCFLPDNLDNQKQMESEAILQTMFLGLVSLAEQYPDFLKVEQRRC